MPAAVIAMGSMLLLAGIAAVTAVASTMRSTSATNLSTLKSGLETGDNNGTSSFGDQDHLRVLI